MIFPDQWTTDGWLLPAILLTLVATAALFYSYYRQWSSPVTWPAFLIKLLAIALLGVCLLEPKVTQQRAEPGANSLIVMADRSQSLQLADPGSERTRAEQLQSRLTEEIGWLQDLESDFQLRKYLVDRQLEPVTSFRDYEANGQGSQLLTNLQQALQRPAGKPLAGVLLLTDGNASDLEVWKQWEIDENTVPIYPVMVGSTQAPRDLSLLEVTASESNFEAAPVSFQARCSATGYSRDMVVIQLLDQDNEVLDQKEIKAPGDSQEFQVQLRTSQKQPGVAVYRVRICDQDSVPLEGEQWQAQAREATLANNLRSIVVDRGRSPLRLLYVTGRPNWELKYLRRAVYDDQELELVALVRIAKREAKFTFRGRDGQESNSLFRGFENQDDDTAERFDEPVFIRLGTRDGEELRGGFPKERAELFQYDAVILDDVEAEFFTQDQQTMLQEFAAIRGGGVMMLGGQESFQAGSYDKTAIGEMLPVYLDARAARPEPDLRYNLTREGWLQPWVRIHTTQQQEQQRLEQMPRFFTLNPISSIKPGATVLAQVADQSGQEFPALVVQPFGKGRSAAWLIGDLWRWQLRTPVENDDLLAFWRQVMRWLVSDVPGRMDLMVDSTPDNPSFRQLTVTLSDAEFRPQDNAEVDVTVTDPEGTEIPVSVKADDNLSGRYTANYYAERPGVYRVRAETTDSATGRLLRRETAWVNQPEAEEFARLLPHREAMQELATATGGEVIDLDDLDQLVNELPNRQVPIQKTVSHWWWHRWSIFLLGLSLLIGEWGMRRWKGMP